MSGLSFEVPAEMVEAIAKRAAEFVLAELADQTAPASSPYLSVEEAAEYLRAAKHRVYDLWPVSG